MGLWLVSGRDRGRLVVGFFGGVGYYAWVSLAEWFRWWVLFGVSQVGYGLEIAVRCGGNWHRVVSINSRLDRRGGREAPSHKQRER